MGGIYSAELTKAEFSAQEPKSAGFFADELKSQNFKAVDLIEAGFIAKHLQAAGPQCYSYRKPGFR